VAGDVETQLGILGRLFRPGDARQRQQDREDDADWSHAASLRHWPSVNQENCVRFSDNGGNSRCLTERACADNVQLFNKRGRMNFRG
jgi:hypothetical protein